jgi:hypothetical protein
LFVCLPDRLFVCLVACLPDCLFDCLPSCLSLAVKRTTNSSELHGKADIKFVVKNEYAQIKPAIEAVKKALR